MDDHFIGSRTEFPPDAFGDLALPVVSPEGDLNINALRNAKARLGQTQGFTESEKNRAEQIINRLANDEFDADFDSEEENDMSNDNLKHREHNGLEYRNFGVELRADDDGRIEGLAAVYGETTDVGGFKERIQEGAFSKTAAESDMRALWNHDTNFVLGRVSSGTLDVEDTEDGLRYSVDPPDTQWANDLKKSIKRGDVKESSIGMNVVRDELMQEEGDDEVRVIKEAEVRDVSPVTFPAYPQTSAESRNQKIIERASVKAGADLKELARLILRSERGEIKRPRDKEILDTWLKRLKSLEISDRITYAEIERKKMELELEAETV